MDLRHGFPYSLIKNGLPFDYPKLAENTACTVVVMGAGIAGALSAFYLTRAGIDCIVVDQRTVGLGSTCASTSLIQYELDKPLFQLCEMIGAPNAMKVYRLCNDTLPELQNISTGIHFTGFSKSDSIYFAARATHSNRLKQEFEARKQCGLQVKLLDKAELMDTYGLRSACAIRSTNAGVMDAYEFTHCLHQHNKKAGCRVYDRTGITAISYRTKGVELTTQAGHKIKASFIVNATGYQAEEKIGSKVKLMSTFAVASEQMTPRLLGNLPSSIFWSTADPYLYIRTTSDHRIIAGGRDVAIYAPAARDKLLKRKANLLGRDVEKVVKEIRFIPEFSWTGTFGVTRDSLAYIGMHPKYPHTYFALGFGGNGIVFSVIAGRIIADALKRRHNPHAHLFSFNRK